MNRRTLLLQLTAVGTLAGSGCLGGQSRDGLAIEGSASTLNPGDDAVILATAYNASQVSFSRLPDTQIEVTAIDVSPPPDRQLDSYPPGWVWETPQSAVEATLRVSAPPDADTGAYEYGVNASNGDKRITAEFTITVQDGTN